MDIHKPKPWHGWPEFLKEIGTIVIGVLIALAAEQAVEWLHWGHEVEAERESLMAEASNSLSAIRHRQDQQPCTDRRLSELHLVLERHAQRQPLGIIAPVGQPTRMTGALGTWQIAVAGQALTHMPHHEKLAFSSAFDVYARWNALIASEADAWSRLAALNEPTLLSETGWDSIGSAYWQAVHVNERLRSLGPYIFKLDNLVDRLIQRIP